MRLSKGQLHTRNLTERFSGCSIPECLLRPFFDKTDRGIEPNLKSEEDRDKFSQLMAGFRLIALHSQWYVTDFRERLLFPSDFSDDRLLKGLAWRAWCQAFPGRTSATWKTWFMEQGVLNDREAGD